MAQNLSLLLAGLDFHQKQNYSSPREREPVQRDLASSASHGSPAHLRLVLRLAWLRAEAANPPGSHSVYCFVTFSEGFKCSTFPHSGKCTPLTKPLCLPYYYLFFMPYLFLTPGLLFPHKVDDQVDCLKPYLLGGFLSPLPFRAALNWAIEKQLPILGLYSHMELTRLPSMAIFLLQISLAIS